MPENSVNVYLDHLILRESLRYHRPQEAIETDQNKPNKLPIINLDPNRSNTLRYLRKPDFQRATWAWSPQECVDLLESVIKRQVIPSIIMWTSPDSGLDYILDGGHRLSVVIAWLKNDWGFESAKEFDDPTLRRDIQRIAREVEELVKIKIGSISEYIDAEIELQKLLDEGYAPKNVLEPKIFNRGRFYQELSKGFVTFDILWASGNYETAEQSFLKINKSGRQLLDWEIILWRNDLDLS
jgi:hypothetical protein